MKTILRGGSTSLEAEIRELIFDGSRHEPESEETQRTTWSATGLRYANARWLPRISALVFVRRSPLPIAHGPSTGRFAPSFVEPIMESVDSIADLLAVAVEAVAWGAGFMACYRGYDWLLAKAGWGKDE